MCYQTSTQTHTDRQTGCAAQTALLHVLCRYLERQRYLTNLGKNSKCPTTFEEFCVHVVHTAPSRRPVSPQLSAPPTTGHTNAKPRSPAAPSNCGQHLPSPPPTESRRRRANTFSGSAPSCEQHITGTLHHTTPHRTSPHHSTLLGGAERVVSCSVALSSAAPPPTLEPGPANKPSLVKMHQQCASPLDSNPP